MRIAQVLIVYAIMLSAIVFGGKTTPAAPARDASVPHDMAQPRDLALPALLPRSLSDAYNYNRLQRTVLEQQRDRILGELGRLKVDEQQLAEQLKAYQIDVAAGDFWDERTLEIHRRKSP